MIMTTGLNSTLFQIKTSTSSRSHRTQDLRHHLREGLNREQYVHERYPYLDRNLWWFTGRKFSSDARLRRDVGWRLQGNWSPGNSSEQYNGAQIMPWIDSSVPLVSRTRSDFTDPRIREEHTGSVWSNKVHSIRERAAYPR